MLTFSTTWLPSHLRTPRPASRRTIDETIHDEVDWVARLRPGRRPSRRRRTPVPAHPPPADPRGDRRDRGGARPPRCPRTSAASATGTTATAGCATPRSRIVRADRGRRDRRGAVLARLAAARGRRRPGRPPDHVHRRRLAAPARARRSTSSPGTPARGRCGSATGRSTSGRRDVLGEVMIALEDGPRVDARLQPTTRGPCSACWSTTSPRPGRRRDNGLWEIRGPLQHFTHSRVMVWAAFDRAVRAVERHGLTGDVDRWRDAARPGPRGGADRGLRRGAQHVHPALRDPGGRRLAPDAARWSASSTATTRGCSAPSRRSSRT